ncbi:hypothetical protein OESDEN_15950 [Oesophagostomum dentatum]|uniref:Uncharacterized protein n=1 Tax=Oesophagostomum dentatum TaxID=61180 RepID=A0A0B1SHD1_OESDE|nr:hypothetical protein OESDEN_15950 [Oesophagostomum dentatum]
MFEKLKPNIIWVSTASLLNATDSEGIFAHPNLMELANRVAYDGVVSGLSLEDRQMLLSIIHFPSPKVPFMLLTEFLDDYCRMNVAAAARAYLFWDTLEPSRIFYSGAACCPDHTPSTSW